MTEWSKDSLALLHYGMRESMVALFMIKGTTGLVGHSLEFGSFRLGIPGPD